MHISDEKGLYLETECLILRDYREDDFSEYYRLKSEPETMYYLQDIQMFTKEEAYEDFCMILEDMKKSDRQFYFFHIELKDTHEQVGSVGFERVMQKCGMMKEAEHIDYEWHDGRMKNHYWQSVQLKQSK